MSDAASNLLTRNGRKWCQLDSNDRPTKHLCKSTSILVSPKPTRSKPSSGIWSKTWPHSICASPRQYWWAHSQRDRNPHQGYDQRLDRGHQWPPPEKSNVQIAPTVPAASSWTICISSNCLERLNHYNHGVQYGLVPRSTASSVKDSSKSKQGINKTTIEDSKSVLCSGCRKVPD